MTKRNKVSSPNHSTTRSQSQSNTPRRGDKAKLPRTSKEAKTIKNHPKPFDLEPYGPPDTKSMSKNSNFYDSLSNDDDSDDSIKITAVINKPVKKVADEPSEDDEDASAEEIEAPDDPSSSEEGCR